MEHLKLSRREDFRVKIHAMMEASLVGVAPIAAVFSIWGLVLGNSKLLLLLIPLVFSYKKSVEVVQRDKVIRAALIMYASLGPLAILAFYYVHGAFILVLVAVTVVWCGIVGIRVERHLMQAANNSLQARRP